MKRILTGLSALIGMVVCSFFVGILFFIILHFIIKFW